MEKGEKEDRGVADECTSKRSSGHRSPSHCDASREATVPCAGRGWPALLSILLWHRALCPFPPAAYTNTALEKEGFPWLGRIKL